MTFGDRVIELRKAKGISQVDLAKQLDIHKNVLGRYERDQAKPSIETAAKIANLLGVSLDYLVGNVSADLDRSIVEKVLSIQSLPEEERGKIMETMEALVRDAKARFAYAS